jgi:hypothetical protein
MIAASPDSFGSREPITWTAPQLILELGSPRQVVEDAGEVFLAVDLHLADREMQRELLAVAAHAGHGAADADDPALAGVEMMADISVVLRSIRLGHQHADVAAEHIGFGMAEHVFGRMIERLDAAARVDHDDAVDGCVDDRSPARIRNPQRVDGRAPWLRIAHQPSVYRLSEDRNDGSRSRYSRAAP